MKKLIIIIIITVVIFSNCKSSKEYTEKEKRNIKITDSIANAQMQDRIIDLREEQDFIIDYD